QCPPKHRRYPRMKYWLGLLLALAMAVPAWAQGRGHPPDGSFHVTWQSERDGTVPGVEGQIVNGLPVRVTDVRVRIEGIDGNGRPVGARVVWALGDIDPGAGTSFRTAAMPGAVDYRVKVLSYDAVSGFEAP